MAETLVQMIQEGKDISTTLTDTERERFDVCEQVIKKGLGTFLDVGCSLAEIRDNRLYRETHKTFEKYCKEIWDLSKGYATQQICGYEAVTLLESKMVAIATKNKSEDTDQGEEKCTDCPHRKALANKDKGVKIPGEFGKCTRPEGLCEKHTQPEDPARQEIVLPINEAQTRPLTKLAPDDQVKAWGLVLQWLNDGKKLTAGLVNKAAKEVKGEAIVRKVANTQQAVDKTTLVSQIFKKQYQVMLDVISAERNTNYATSSPKVMVQYLEKMIEVIKMDN
ncbi:MAG: hypothetical protein KKE62_01835 [Proteobacteria bacterium]|nr:hypothetical protein [Pseudomonadota bacterium]MBU1387121.1 hypothetical protein [Pseudomonadota bacterium]MBU1541562.1 hypothetical protein [Pseudomonadota bacterium]MBU2429087.1 hypothetical protein [Pseudomonadota bacterium]MBU2482768.1 hypothetical protein [Pseudomonadota bacterium]